jgi:tetratricopeptide (TPR) repeat protein
MQFTRVFLTILFMSVVAAALTFGAHTFLKKRAEVKNPEVAQTSGEDSEQAGPPEQNLPAVEPPKADVAELMKPLGDDPELSLKAKDSLLKKDYRAALQWCGRLAEKDHKAFLCVGMSHFMLTEYRQAIPPLENALAAGADAFTCRKHLAFAYYYTHELDKAIENAEKGLELKKEEELQAFHARLMREKNAHRNFVSESSAHFKIQYDGYAHSSISRSVLGILEDAYSTIGRDMDYYPQEKITVILYTKHDFQDVTRAPGWVGGFFDKRDGKIRVPVKGAEGQESLLKTVLFHEYVHALIYSITKTCPLWVHEGLAEYYAKGPSQEIGQVIPLSRLENSLAGLNGKGIMVAYVESLSAVSHLMERYGSSRMKGMLLSLSRGNNLNGAFTEAFHLSYTEFIEKWGRK